MARDFHRLARGLQRVALDLQRVAREARDLKSPRLALQRIVHRTNGQASQPALPI